MPIACEVKTQRRQDILVLKHHNFPGAYLAEKLSFSVFVLQHNPYTLFFLK